MGNIFGEICSCYDDDQFFEINMRRDRKEERIKFTAEDDFLSVSDLEELDEIIDEVFDGLP